MKSATPTTRSYASMLTIPLAAGILIFPLAGVEKAVHLAGVVFACMLAWRFSRSAATSRRAAAFSPRLHLTEAYKSRLQSIKTSPFFAVLLVSLLLLSPLFFNDYYRDIMTLTCMYIVLALGLNIIVGQAGLLNLGYAAFYAVGAYVYAILSTLFGLSFWLGLAAGSAGAACFALLVGIPTLRLRGDYFAIVTLGLGEIIRIVLNNWDSLTGGPNGISRIGRPVLAGYELRRPLDFYYLILAITLITLFAMKRLAESRIGRAWIAIREDEVAAEAMGINTFRLKLSAFVIGSAWAGLTGVFFAAKMAFVSPESFTFLESVLILCMVVLGGMGSIPGIVLGALLLVTLPEVFRDFQDYRMLAFGAALVLMMVFRPQGLLGRTDK
ncbi:MAG TPA: branched-chain amino acid ABC transporter permease [Nitrospirota bacterium]|nr:branched-chain amino acid ABC transporter permease [Nitrospirota bacterium]